MSDLFERLRSALADRYAIEEKLGSGGMATVYAARDIRHDRLVALKVLRPELAATLGAERFLLEIRVAAKLNHPHILPLYDSGRVAEVQGGSGREFLFYVMPVVEGESLRSRLNREDQLGVDAICSLAEDVGAALDYAHTQGVIHRDIKPENILYHHGEPMVADFGIALAVKEAGGERLTETGISVGTPQYMSPEQVSGDRQLDARTDVYSLGCVLYEALVGEPPFTGPSAMAVMARQVTDPVRPIATVRPDVPQHMVGAVTQALAKVPADRFDSAGHLALALATPEPIPPVESAVAVAKQESVPRRTIAVLPFANLSTDPENEYFSDGITDDVMSQLSKVGELKVISRTSTTRFRDTELSLREIGEQLNADVILEGTVRKAGSRVRIVAQLIDARDDTHVWSDTYDRMLTDVFEIQSEVAISIAEALEAELSEKERSEIQKKPTDDLEAYDLYLLGRHHCNKRAADDLRSAITYFEQAIERDADYADAYAGLAEAYVFAGIGYMPMPSAEAFALAKEMALRAIQLNPDRATAHAMLGFTALTCDGDVATAERSLSHALELDSNYVQTYQWLGWCRTCVGDYFGGSEAWERALELDPLSAVITAESGWSFIYAGLHELALERFQRSLELDPDFAVAHYCVGWALDHLGRYEEAIQAYEKSVELSGGMPLFKAFLASAYSKVGQRDRAETLLKKLSEHAEQQGGMGVSVAVVAEALGHGDLALDWLERAYSNRDDMPLYAIQIKGFLPFASLRGHPRFQAIIDGLGLLPHDAEGERAKLLERERLKKQGAFPRRAVSPTQTEAPQVPPSSETDVPSQENSIVVRPFANTSPDPDTEYFADGLTEEIIADLSKVKTLLVISRGSAMRLKGSEKDARSIGRELGVRYVLEGSVRKNADDLRITAQLIDAETDRTAWGEKYSGTITQVFEIQESVSRAIVDALKVTLSPEEDSELALRPIDNLQAHEAHLRARFEAWSFSEEALNKAQRYIENAIAIVGDNELLYGTLGLIYVSYTQAGVSGGADLISSAKKCANRVLMMNPNSARGHWLRGFACFTGGDVRSAATDLERAYELDPQDPDATLALAYLMMLFGRVQEACALTQRAIQIDPLTPINHTLLGGVLVYDGRPSEAVQHYAKAYEMDPEPPFLRWTYVWSLLWNRRVEEAAGIVDQLTADFPTSPFSGFAESQLLGVRGQHAQAAERITDGMRSAGRNNEMFSRELVHCYALAGNIEEAIEWLENTIRIGNINYPFWAKHNWFIDSLRGHPRFEQLLNDMEREWAERTGEEIGSVERRVGRVASRSRELVNSPAEPVPDALDSPGSNKSIAVLPFTNKSSDPEDEYFSDGITEDIITLLSKIGALKVISRSSSMQYKQTDKTVREIGIALGVNQLVQGSMRRSGDRVRITAQLIDVGTDREVWAESYDRELIDVFAIQGDVARSVADALRAELTPAENARIERRPTADMEAYREYLIGRHHWSRWTEDDFKQSIKHFEKAVDRDPFFAEAYGAMSEAWSHLGVGYWGVRPLDAYPKARDAAVRAVELDPESAEANAQLAMVEWWFEFAFDRALERVERATSLNSSCAPAFDYRANILTMLGRHDEALTFGKRACELDPVSIFINANLGLYLYRARRWSDAIAQFQRTIDLDPNLPMGHALQALAYVESGDVSSALEGFERAEQLSAGNHAYRVMLGYGYAAAGERDQALQILREIEDQRGELNVWLVMLAMGYIKLDDTEHALDLLEDAYRERGGWVVWLGVEPGLDALRPNARFRTMMARMGLPQGDTTAGSDPEPSRPSLLVLPFENTSPDPGNEYFGDGLTDELITDLAKVRSLRVIARNSSMKLKGTKKDLTTLGRELDVRYVLEGSVRRAGDNVRITTQLVETSDESPIWAERYSGTMEDVFDLQEQVSRAIVDALNVELSGAEKKVLAERPIPNLIAYEHYLKSRRDLYGFDKESLDRALRNLSDGLEIVGENVLLLRGLGVVHFQMLNSGVSEDESHIDELERCAEKIKKLDAADPGGFMLSGLANLLRGNGRRAVLELSQAYRRNPSDPDTMLWLGVGSLATGQSDRSRIITDELVRVDPMAPLSHLLVGYTAFFQGRFEDMLTPYRKGLELGPDIPVNLWCAVRVFAAAGLRDESLAASQRLQDLHHDTPFAESARIFVAALEDRTSDVVDPSEELRAWAARDGEWGQYLVDAYALAGMEDKALDWLEICTNAGFMNVSFLREHDPFLESIRDSARFGEVMKRVERELEEFEKRLETVAGT